MLLLAVLAFAMGIALSLKASPGILSDVSWSAILVMALIATPATLALNAAEFSLSARMIGQKVPFGRAMTVTILGSAANLLPLPGATLVRLAAYKAGGAPLRSGLSATAMLAILSVGAGLVYSGAWATIISNSPYVVAIAAIGVLMLFGAWMIAREMFDDHSTVTTLIVVRLSLIALDAARTYLAFIAIGSDASFGHASVLTISTVFAAVVAIVPAGLGLREGIAASMAPLINLEPAVAFLATSLSRVVGLAVVMVLTVLLTSRRKVPGTS